MTRCFDEYGCHRLHALAGNGDLDMVKQEVKRGTNIDIEAANDAKWTPLLFAVYQNQIRVVEFLVSKGANVNYQSAGTDTALILAARYGYEDIVKILLTAKADAKIKDRNGNTALGVACKNNRKGVGSLLFDLEKITAAPIAPPAPNPFANRVVAQTSDSSSAQKQEAGDQKQN